MIPAYVLKLVMPMILNKLSDVIKYVREDNELDKQVRALKKEVILLGQDLETLKGWSHPPVFKEEQLEDIHKRLKKLEKKK
tara:strand:- start:217 stop:459 length:243 start_codon:yes stop_codon:yes gene_type:complete